MKLKVLDLFSGIGGFSLGLERTGGFETVAFCEIEDFPRRVLAKHWPSVPCYRDVRELTAKRLAADGIAVDVICGGFPCQDISTAGKGAGLAGERSGLWSEIARLVGELGPQYVIVENVSALLGRGLGTVLGDLATIGYDAEWHCIPASHVGAPHRRDRIWIIAYPRIYSGTNAQTVAQRADTNCFGSHRETINVKGSAELRDEQVGLPGSLGEVLADSFIPRWERGLHRWANSQRESLAGHLVRCRSMDGQPIENWWSTEPDVGRVANGIPDRSHRLKGLGNAVVPQIPELIGNAILSAIDLNVK